MDENTIVVMTSDHGELGGAHGMVDKGPTVYKEQNHVPLIISHPAHPATHGKTCGALTSHLDLAPTLVKWAKAHTHDENSLAARVKLPGRDIGELLRAGGGIDTLPVNQLRDACLFNFNMLAFVDSTLCTCARRSGSIVASD